MAHRPPPVPPAGRTDKGPGPVGEKSSDSAAASQEAQQRKVPDNVDKQDRQGNIKQNTTNQGYQQDR